MIYNFFFITSWRPQPFISVFDLHLKTDILVIPWRSVLLLEETTDLSQVTEKHYHIRLHRTQALRAWNFPETPVVSSTHGHRCRYHSLQELLFFVRIHSHQRYENKEG